MVRFADAPTSGAKALVNKGLALDELGRGEEALPSFDQVVTRFGDAPEVAFREVVAQALYSTALTLSGLGRDEEAFVASDQVVVHFGDAPEPALREQVAQALSERDLALHQLGRPPGGARRF